MADVEQMKKIVTFVTCEMTFHQNVCELMFGVNVPNLNLRVQIDFCQKTNPVQLCGSLIHVSLWDFGLFYHLYHGFIILTNVKQRPM